MSSMNVFYPRRRKPAKMAYKPRTRAFASSRPSGSRSVATQASSGRKPRANYKLGPSIVSRIGNAVSTQVSGSRTRTDTLGRTNQSKPYVRLPRKSRQINTVNEMVKASLKSVPFICQQLNEDDGDTGANFLRNDSEGGNTGERPLHIWALNTTDRSAAGNFLGDSRPQFILTQTTNFLKPSGASDPDMVYGNTQDSSNERFTALTKMMYAYSKIKLQFYGRLNRDTTYKVQVIRLKKFATHLSPYMGSEEALDASTRLTASQLEERKAFWIDHILREQTVNPCVISRYGLSKFKKYYEVLYSKKIEIQETLTDEDQANRTSASITLPINKMMSFNWEIDDRYASSTTAAGRVDDALNTNTSDLTDTKSASKPAPWSGLFLLVTANHSVTTTEDATTRTANVNYEPRKIPSYDISFKTVYKTLDLDHTAQ